MVLAVHREGTLDRAGTIATLRPDPMINQANSVASC